MATAPADHSPKARPVSPRRVAALTAAVAIALTLVAPRVVWPDQDCSDFRSQGEAQLVLERLPWDHHHLDGDHDGVACEALAPRRSAR
jgi:hypothetical protein